MKCVYSQLLVNQNPVFELQPLIIFYYSSKYFRKFNFQIYKKYEINKKSTALHYKKIFLLQLHKRKNSKMMYLYLFDYLKE